MSDNITVSEGSGSRTKTIAADEIAGVLHQRIKIGIGEDGSATDVSAVNPLPVSIADEVTTTVPRSFTSSITSVSSSAASQNALASNDDRTGLLIVNLDEYAALIKFGAIASTSSFTVRLVQNAQYEMLTPVYTGRVDVIWEGDGTGSIVITELT